MRRRRHLGLTGQGPPGTCLTSFATKSDGPGRTGPSGPVSEKGSGTGLSRVKLPFSRCLYKQ